MEYSAEDISPVRKKVVITTEAQEVEAAIMFKLPSLPNVRECLINQAVIDKGKEPVLLFGDKAENADTSKAQAGGDKAS